MKRVGYVYLGDVPTRVATWGKWIEDPFTEDESKELILFIPGNPGLTQLYEPFLQTVYDRVKTPVWIVGHSGHEKPKDLEKYKIPDPRKDKNKFDLDAQISYKLTFIEKYIPDDVKIHLLGHSAGCYMILHLLEYPNIKRHVTRSYLLFPTIEYVGDTVNGKIFLKLVKPIVPILIFLSWIFTLLPGFIQTVLVHIVRVVILWSEVYHFNAMHDIVDPYVLRNILDMAVEQLMTVRERPDDKLRKHLDVIQLYYGKSDGWVHRWVPAKIRGDIPGINVEVCQRGMGHMFAIWQPKQMGEIVGNWLAAVP